MLIVGNSLREYFILMTNAFGIESCTCTDTVFKGYMTEEVHPDAGGRCIGNTHLTNT